MGELQVEQAGSSGSRGSGWTRGGFPPLLESQVQLSGGGQDGVQERGQNWRYKLVREEVGFTVQGIYSIPSPM